MSKYYLGVDGGNTKTDYLLCTADGGFKDVFRTGTCSHEAFENGYDGMEAAMSEQLSRLLERNGIGIDILPECIAVAKKRIQANG